MAAPRQDGDFTPRLGSYCVTHTPSGRTVLGHGLHLDGLLNRVRFQLQNDLRPNKSWPTDAVLHLVAQAPDGLRHDALATCPGLPVKGCDTAGQ